MNKEELVNEDIRTADNYNKVNPMLLLHLIKDQVIIKENPLFYSSKNTILLKDNKVVLVLREPAFSGLAGKLSINETADILFQEQGKELLAFLSIFSGRLYELRSKYYFDLLPAGYAERTKNSLIGYHYPKSFRYKEAVHKNKSIHDLRTMLQYKFGSNNCFVIQRHKMVECKPTNKYILGNILLGAKALVRDLEIHCYFNSIQEMEQNSELLKDLSFLIPIYSPFYTVKIYITGNWRICLGEYKLGSGEQKERNKNFYDFYDENYPHQDIDII